MSGATPAAAAAVPPLDRRVAALPWSGMAEELDARGYATTGPLLTAAECRRLTALYDGAADRFRSRIVMGRHAFGCGEYRYFAHPLPGPVETLRRATCPVLAPIANRWAAALGAAEDRYPGALDTFPARCAAAGQVRPTPLLLRYDAGGFNRLHRDLYGALAFPLQTAVLLSAPGRDFAGGEFVLVEQRPRTQARAEAVPLALGEAVVFAVHHRPARGTRGFHRLALRHGVSRVRAGRRHALGVNFHDAA